MHSLTVHTVYARPQCYTVYATGHHGPVYSVARNPLLPKAFATVGDWTVRLWNEELRPALCCSQYRPGYLQGGKWSTTRCVA